MAGLRKIPGISSLKEPSKASSRSDPPPPAKTAGRPMPDLDKIPVRPRGEALYKLGQERDNSTGGPGVKPAAFPGTQPEYVWFWASRKYFGEADPRTDGNYLGGKTWAFQVPDNPVQPKAAGSSIADFVYTQPGGQQIIVRIEGFFWHIGQGAEVQARDQYLMNQAPWSGDQAHRVNDFEFMDDESGSKAIKLLADILANRPRVGKLQGGTVTPPRYDDFLP